MLLKLAQKAISALTNSGTAPWSVLVHADDFDDCVPWFAAACCAALQCDTRGTENICLEQSAAFETKVLLHGPGCTAMIDLGGGRAKTRASCQDVGKHNMLHSEGN
jgi:hypothetical protein